MIIHWLYQSFLLQVSFTLATFGLSFACDAVSLHEAHLSLSQQTQQHAAQVGIWKGRSQCQSHSQRDDYV